MEKRTDILHYFRVVITSEARSAIWHFRLTPLTSFRSPFTRESRKKLMLCSMLFNWWEDTLSSCPVVVGYNTHNVRLSLRSFEVDTTETYSNWLFKFESFFFLPQKRFTSELWMRQSITDNITESWKRTEIKSNAHYLPSEFSSRLMRLLFFFFFNNIFFVCLYSRKQSSLSPSSLLASAALWKIQQT